MTELLTDIALVLVFIAIGGTFAAAETALISLRDSQVRTISMRGRRGHRVARLAADPNRLRSAVQVGVTLAGFLAAATGAATLADHLRPLLVRWGVSPGLVGALAIVVITVVIACLSLVLGDLAARRLVLQRAERVSLALAPSVDRLAQVARPLIWLLSRSTDVVVRLAGGDPTPHRDVITEEEELREIVAEHESLGHEKRKIVEDVFSAGERQLREVMVPRTEVDFLDAKTPIFKAVQSAINSPHSRYPVIDGSQDNVVGFVHVRDLLAPAVANRSLRVGEIVRKVVYLPSTKRVLAALSEMRREGQHLAIVLDEYGGTFGIVTLEDLVEELVGDIRDEYDLAAPGERRAVDGTLEVDGLLTLVDFEEESGIDLPEGPYETVAGFVMSALGRLSVVGDAVSVEDWKLVVTALDGRRIERLRVEPRAGPAGAVAGTLDAPLDGSLHGALDEHEHGDGAVDGEGRNDVEGEDADAPSPEPARAELPAPVEPRDLAPERATSGSR